MRKIIPLYFLSVFCVSNHFGQETIKVRKTNSEVFTVVDQQAVFPGGIGGLNNFVRQNIVFPERCRKDSTFKNCKVYVKFIVNEDGSTSDPQVLKGCPNFPECESEALKLVTIMPKWTPALIKTPPLRQIFICLFRLNYNNYGN